MSDINQVKLRGRAGGDAEVKTLPNATLVTVRIATGESYTDRSGSKVDRTDWHLVACWGQMADQACGIRKGDVVQVEGKIQRGVWQVFPFRAGSGSTSYRDLVYVAHQFPSLSASHLQPYRSCATI